MSDKPISDYTDALEARIAELEAEVARLEGENAGLSRRDNTLRDAILIARRALQKVGEWDGSEIDSQPPPDEQRMTVSTCVPCLGAGRHDLGGGSSSKCAACAGTGLQGPPAEDADE